MNWTKKKKKKLSPVILFPMFQISVKNLGVFLFASINPLGWDDMPMKKNICFFFPLLQFQFIFLKEICIFVKNCHDGIGNLGESINR